MTVSGNKQQKFFHHIYKKSLSMYKLWHQQHFWFVPSQSSPNSCNGPRTSCTKSF